MADSHVKQNVVVRLDPEQIADIKATVKRVEERVVAKVKEVEQRLMFQENLLSDARSSLSTAIGVLSPEEVTMKDMLAIANVRDEIADYLDQLEPFVIDLEQIEEEAMKDDADQS